MKPALTAEEWETGKVVFKDRGYDSYGVELASGRKYYDPDDGAYVIVFDGSWAAPIKTEHQHGAAALLLCGQPFGFTWEDVDALIAADKAYGDCGLLIDVAVRIAALLPPRGSI